MHSGHPRVKDTDRSLRARFWWLSLRDIFSKTERDNLLTQQRPQMTPLAL